MGRRVVHRAAYVSPEEVRRRRKVMADASAVTRRTIIALDIAEALRHVGPAMSPSEFKAALDAHDGEPE
jgi:hypothetical protein